MTVFCFTPLPGEEVVGVDTLQDYRIPGDGVHRESKVHQPFPKALSNQDREENGISEQF